MSAEKRTRIEHRLQGKMSRRMFLKSALFGAVTVTANAAMEQPLLAAVVGEGTATAFANGAIQFDPKQCIGCGKCVNACETQGLRVLQLSGEKSGVADDLDNCIGCGQCTSVCPAGAMTERDGLQAVQAAMQAGKTMVWQFAPSVQHMAGEPFGMPSGQDVSSKLAAAIHQMGGIAYRTDCGADFTILEEATEFVERLQNGGPLPLITSCCPGWINYVMQTQPTLLKNKNISTCKSPMEMLAALVKTKHRDSYHVAVMPCTAKKMEAARPELDSMVDQVLTVREFAQFLQSKNMNLAELQDDVFDQLFDENSGAGRIFGASGGVMEAALRTAYPMLTGKELSQVEMKPLRGNAGIKTTELSVHGTILKVAVVNGIGEIKTLLPKLNEYHFVEVMACPGGCAGGGGRPLQGGTVVARQNGMYAADRISRVRRSHENRDVKAVYGDLLGQPGDGKAKALLHVTYNVSS